MEHALEQRFEAWLARLAAGTDALAPAGLRVDAHTHLGIDAGSGLEMAVDALDHQLEVAGVDQAILIPLNASDGYHRTNLRLVERARESGGRFHALYRLDQRDPDLAGHVAEGFDAGAVGLKLHPASDGISPIDPRIAPALEQAQERGALVLVHTGVDVHHAAPQTIDAARRYPGARFVLGHLPAEALAETIASAHGLENVWTCLSWWGALDVAYAMQWADPSRLLHGSDPPYGHAVTGFAQTVRTARALGYDDAQVAAVIGGNAASLLGGAVPERTGAMSQVPGVRDLLAELPLSFRRCYLGLLAAVATDWSEGTPDSYWRFAEQALEQQLVPTELRDAADELRETLELANDLARDGAREQAYAVGTGALTLALTLRFTDEA